MFIFLMIKFEKFCIHKLHEIEMRNENYDVKRVIGSWQRFPSSRNRDNFAELILEERIDVEWQLDEGAFKQCNLSVLAQRTPLIHKISRINRETEAVEIFEWITAGRRANVPKNAR